MSRRANVIGALLLILATGPAPSAATAGIYDRPIRICTVGWEPFFGEDLPRQGFFTEIVRQAFNAVGIETKFEFMPWKRAIKEVEEGDRDILMGAFYTEERKQLFHASLPVYPNVVGLVSRGQLDFDRYDSLYELEGYTIGVGRGYSNGPEFDAAEFLTREPASQVQNIRKLYAGRIDLAAGNFLRFNHIAGKEGFDSSELVYLDPPLTADPLYMLASRRLAHSPKLLAAFDRGLEIIRDNGTEGRILERMGFAEYDGFLRENGYRDGY